ncbi:MAG: transglutaminase family protein [Beijerinckiaceae bacterium]|nr:transglutaminase family protein [Beijerinckiaceae bacterium]
MHIRYGYKITFEFAADTPIITMLDIHPSRRHDITEPDEPRYTPSIEPEIYQDSFGNLCRRILAPRGTLTIESEGVVHDSGFPDPIVPDAEEVPVAALPAETLLYLLGSRYCETDKLSQTAWDRFGSVQPGWSRVQAIVDFVHEHITFGYHHASSTRSALDVYNERVGVCRDFAHLAVTLCRAMNIPARYCTGYLGDIGVPKDPAPMDFSAWFEVFLGDRWYAFDARHNRPRIGRILIGIGRDASDVPIMNSFASHRLAGFEVITDEIVGPRYPATSEDRRRYWGGYKRETALKLVSG